jgi:hypothetical protein
LRGQSKEKRVLLESLKKKLFESIEKDKDKKKKSMKNKNYTVRIEYVNNKCYEDNQDNYKSHVINLTKIQQNL